jgi:hypothetical protein
MSTYISTKLRQQVRTDAGRGCGYCLSSEILTGIPLEIEHIIPEARGGLTERENLWLACHSCNKFKSDRIRAEDPLTKEIIPLFNPRTQNWHEHFRWNLDGALIIGLTPCGRATVEALQMNNDYVVEARRFWVLAGLHPPVE